MRIWGSGPTRGATGLLDPRIECGDAGVGAGTWETGDDTAAIALYPVIATYPTTTMRHRQGIRMVLSVPPSSSFLGGTLELGAILLPCGRCSRTLRDRVVMVADESRKVVPHSTPGLYTAAAARVCRELLAELPRRKYRIKVNILLLRCNYEHSCVMPVVTNAAVIRSAEVSFASRPARPHLLATR